MKIISWNVNGIRACSQKGLSEFLQKESPDVFCIQETKAHIDQVEPFLRDLGYKNSKWVSAQKKGYSGVATFTRIEDVKFEIGIGIEDYDNEGRILKLVAPNFELYNIYFPNGGAREERHLFKQKFLKDLNVHLKAEIELKKSIIVVGDYNVAHDDIDVYDPIRLSSESGFLPEERDWFDRFLNLGMIDTYRHFYPDKENQFSWWSYRELARAQNKGWRIDYICTSKDLKPYFESASILMNQEGSDHCPVVLNLKDSLQEGKK